MTPRTGTVDGSATLSADDFVSNFEFFRDLFVPENRIDLPVNPAHERIADTLQDAFLGEMPPGIEYVVINCPPRIGKTKLIQSTACWAKAYFPDAQFIFTAYAADLAEESLAYIGKTLRERWYVDTFGDILHGRSADHLTTAQGGNSYAEGTAGSLTGKGAGLKRPAGGLFVIDDASKPEEALSQVEAKNKQRWFETTAKNRRNSDQHCVIVIIGQRLGPDDLPGYVLRTYPEKTLLIKVPALVDPQTGAASTQDTAVSQFPETWSTSNLLDYRKTRVGRFVLATTFQQNEATLGGNLIPMDSFHRYDLATARTLRWEKLVMPVDTALKIKQHNDYSAVALWGLMQRRVYLIDLLHGKWETPELLENVAVFWDKWCNVEGWPRPRLVIEEKAAGTPLLQTLNRRGVPAVGIERDQDKVRRVNNVLPQIESGLVFIPKSGEGAPPWLDKWETEPAQFAKDGSHAHDDMVDTTVDGIEQLMGKLSIWDVLGKPNR